jgi:serine/threonine protein kinase/formylglycine-generating enzyme required for sulfatase activity
MSGSSQSESCAETAAPRFPSALPQYEFLEFLGGGGMGEIYKARHVHLDRLVVIKWLRTDLAVGPHMDARFAREMLAVGQLNHPNIVAATDAGIANGRRYLVMEYIDGIDLAELCRRVGRLTIADACEIVRQSAIGLAHAHDRGIVHRDIKPTNLMLPRDGMVKLLDLGLALLQQEGEVGSEAPLTRADSGPFGTYDYMSPEQWNNSHEVDPRGDIYSLGCTLYFLLTGHAPFDTPQHKSATAKMRGHVLEAPPSIRKERSDVPKRLAAVIERTLAKDANERYQSAADLAVELEEFIPGCDLPSLSSAAQGMRTTAAAADVRTDPESATMLVGSSVGGAKSPGSKVKALSATGMDTAVGRAKTNLRAVAGVRPKKSRGWVPWMAGGAIALVLLGAGGGYLLSLGNKQKMELGAGGQQVADRGGSPDRTPTPPSIAGGTSDAGSPSEIRDTVADVASTTDSTARQKNEMSAQSAPGEPAADVVVDHGASGAASVADQTQTPPDGGRKMAAEANPSSPPATPPPPAVVPLFEPIPVQVAREQQPFSLLVSLTNQVELAGKIAFALAPDAPQGMRIDPASGVVRWEPREEDGSADARIAVKVLVKPLAPGVEMAQTTFEIRVEEVNKAPRIARLNGAAAGLVADVDATEGEQVEVLITAADDDLPLNPLKLLPVEALPEMARLVPVADNERSWKLIWTPGEAQGGGDVIRVPLKVRDEFESGPAITLAFRVVEVNQPPVLTRVNSVAWREDAPWKVSGVEDEPLELMLQADDADLPANPLTLKSVDPLPDGAEIIPVEGSLRAWKLRWTPGEPIGGGKPVLIRLQVADAGDTSAVRSVLLDVAEVNAAPELAAIDGRAVKATAEWSVTAREGKLLEVALAGRDDDLPANPLTIEPVGRLPAGAKIVPDADNPRAWKLQWTPGEDSGGDEPVRIPLQVKDPETSGSAVALLVKVAEDNVAPVIESIGGAASKDGKRWDVAAKEGERLALTIVGGDADRPANPLQLTADKPLPDGAKIEPVKDQPRQWSLNWTPAEEHGGGAAVEFSLSIRDQFDASAPGLVLVRVSEVNSPPVLPELAGQKVGVGEMLTLDVPVEDPDLPRQELTFELEPPEGMGISARWLDTENGRPTLRITWRPDAVADLGTTKRLMLRVRDSGDPAMSVERTFDVEVGRYLRNSIGMEFALVPTGEFQMGNLDPEQLQKIIPKAPPKPPVPNRPGGVPNAPLRNPTQPGRPFDPTNPAVPATEPAAGDVPRGADTEDVSERPEPAKPDDLPVRTIAFTKSIYFGAFEVTQQQYETVMGGNPSYFSLKGRGQRAVADVATERLPVDSVSYDEVVEFCRRLSARPEEQERGRVYRLPTEAEWEYACRAGTGTLFSTGDRLSSHQANFDGRYPLPGMEAGPGLERTATVGSYEPNAFGLHDMHGNVSEWCSDWYATDAYEQDAGPAGPEAGERRVLRGGNYRSIWAYQCRSSIRDSRPPTDHVPRIGFRVVLEERPVGPALPAPRK